MAPRRRKRLEPSVFEFPVEQIKAGFFSELGSTMERAILGREKQPARVHLQVIGRQGGYLSGIDEVVALLKLCADDWTALTIQALYEGDRFEEGDVVLTIEGEYLRFAQLESLCLGILSRRTRVCANARRLSEAAGSKTLCFVGAAQEPASQQPGDGLAAHVGGIKLVTTAALASLSGASVSRMMPRTLVATCRGSTVAAAKRFAAEAGDDATVIVPVDYENDAVKTSVAVAKALDDRLWGVRLDTAPYMVDHSIVPLMGGFDPTGVNAQLAWNVRNALDDEGFGDVKILASGDAGFTMARIQAFSEEGVPVDAYGVGTALYEGQAAFTADVVEVNGEAQTRAGSTARQNPRLERVK